jgi:glutamine synthetase
VRIVFADYNGLLRGRSVSAGGLESALARGVNFSSPTVDFNSRDFFPEDAAFNPTSGDFWAVPDPATYRPVPGAESNVQMFAHLVDAGGDPWVGCPRTMLGRAIRKAADMGLRFNVAFEPEGYVFASREGEAILAGSRQFATADGLDLFPEFVSDLLSYLSTACVEVEQWSEEYGPGQMEVNLHYSSPLESADNCVLFKQAFRALARKRGLIATFMPKPFEGQAGSGLHVHLSAYAQDEPETNLFDDASDKDLALSRLGRHVLGGLMEHGEALTALGATTVNSYKRFLPGSWAPTRIDHAYASREAFIRIPERRTPRRLELRVGDPAGNPYLFLTGILAAAMDGVERALDPGAATNGQANSDPRLSVAGGVRPVPSTLEHALDALEADSVMREALGPLIADEFLKIKRSEWEAFARHVGPWDREWYLHRF